MKTSSADYLQAAERALSKANIVIDVQLFDEAGRLAYYAMFHAAQALIYERTDKVSKTHKEVNQLFHQLVRDESSLDGKIAADLSNAYLIKEKADYETGAVVPVTREIALDAIAAAVRVVAQVRDALSQQGPRQSDP